MCASARGNPHTPPRFCTRPRIVDAQGEETWGQLTINNKVLTVTIPQELLNRATYPIRHAAGLTFGKTTVGGTHSA